MTTAITNRLRKICLALPEAEEKEAWGDPTFRLKGKIRGEARDGRAAEGRFTSGRIAANFRLTLGAIRDRIAAWGSKQKRRTSKSSRVRGLGMTSTSGG